MPVAELNQTELQSGAAPVPTAGKKLEVMPPLKTLMTSAAVATAVPVGLLLAGNHPWSALGVTGGFLLGAVLHAMLYVFIQHGMTLFGAVKATSSSAEKNGQAGGVAVLAVGKFIAVGVLFFLLAGVLKLSLLWLIVGFVVTQFAMIAVILNRLFKTKVTD